MIQASVRGHAAFRPGGPPDGNADWSRAIALRAARATPFCASRRVELNTCIRNSLGIVEILDTIFEFTDPENRTIHALLLVAMAGNSFQM